MKCEKCGMELIKSNKGPLCFGCAQETRALVCTGRVVHRVLFDKPVVVKKKNGQD